MKLHLPKLLRNALLACVTAVAGIATTTVGSATITGAALAFTLSGQRAHALTAQECAAEEKNVVIETDGYYNAGGSVTYANGVLSGSGVSADVTFDMNVDALNGAASLIYVTKDGTSTIWGVRVNDENALTGDWQGATWGNAGVVDLSGVTPNDDGTLTLTANITGNGTFVYKGDSTAEVDRIYNGAALKTSGGTTNTVTVNKTLIERLYVVDSLPAGKEFTHGDYTIRLAHGKHLDATGSRLQLNGGTSGNAATENTTEKPIFVGGSGQLFLQTWGKGAIELDNDIYVASSTHGDAGTFGVIRFGNDASGGESTTLNGNIYVLEDTKLHAGGQNAIYLNGKITDKYNLDGSASAGGATLTLKGHKGFVISGDLDVSNINITAGVTFAKTVKNTGSIMLSGELNINSLEGFDVTVSDNVTYSGGDASNGYASGDFEYTIVDNAEGASCTAVGDSFTLAGLAAGGTFADGKLKVSSSDTSTFWVNTEWTATALGEGKSYYINGGVLNVGGEGVGNLTTARGTTGTMKLTSATLLGSGTSTVFSGALEIASGVQLSLGASGTTGATSNASVDISSLDSVVLDGGTLFMRGVQANLGTIVSKAASTNSKLQVFDMQSASHVVNVKTLQLDSGMTLACDWKSNINIGKLSGSGDLEVTRSQGDTVNLRIDSFEDYTGVMTIGAAGKNTNVTATLNEGQAISASQINLVNTNFTLNGAGILNVGNTISAPAALGFTLGPNWTGYTGVTDAVVTSAVTTTTVGQKVAITNLSVEKGGALTLSGEVLLQGAISLSETIINNTSALTLGQDVIFDLTGMTGTKIGRDTVYQIFTTGDLSGLTEANLSDAFKNAYANSEFMFGADGTFTIVNMAEPVSVLTWAPEDAATNHGTWQDQSIFNNQGDKYEAGGKYDVIFEGITNTANPEKVQISGELTPNSMEVDAGAGTYEFYIGGGAQSGIVSAAEGITIASGTAIFRVGTLAMTEQTEVSVAGTLALDTGSIVDQDKVNITLTNGGTLRWLAGNTTDYSLNGGLAIGENAWVTLDFGTNNVQLEGSVKGAVAGTTIRLTGAAGQTMYVAGGVFGRSALYLDGVNLGLLSGAQYGNDISNNRNTAFAERITIAPAATAADPTNTETILSGNNDGYTGSVVIGDGTTLVFASTNSLGADMALTGTGNVAFSDGGATGPVTHASLNTDDVYTGTTTVRNNTILDWGEETVARSGSIILDNGSTLVLNIGVANGITDGLNTAGLAKGGVTITSLLDEDGEIIPVQWNSADKTYTGLTTVSANTILGATDRISTGAGKVNLSDASSVLHITGGTWHTSWTNTVYGEGTVIVETGANHVNGASRLLNQNDALANLIIRGNGTSLEFQSSSQANPLKAATTITVEDGASFINNAPLENTTGNTIVLNGDGTGAATSGALMLSTYAWSDATVHTTTLGSNIALGSDSVVYVGAHTNNNNKIANIGKLTGTITSNGYTLTKTGIGTLDLTQNLAGADVYVKEGVLRFNTGATVTVDAASTITLADGTTLARYGAAAGKATNKLVVGGTLIAGESADDTTTVRTDNHNGLIELQKLGGQGTLVAEGAQTSDRVSAIMVTGSADTAFDGTIKINQSNNSNSIRNLVLASNSTDALADAVIEMSNSFAQNNKGKIGFALGADTVKIEGLNTVAAVAGKSYVVSDASFFGTSNADMKQDVAALGDGTDRTLEVVGAGTYDYAGTIAADVTVKMSGTGKQTLSGKLAADSDYVAAGGTLAISAKGQSGQHTFTALAGGILDMAGYAADTDAALDDSVVAAGGVLKNLTLAGGMTLTQTDATSKLAGALTLSGGDMVYELNSNAGAYSVSTLYTCEAGTTLTITDATMVFTPDALLGYIDAANGDASGNYKLISGLASITGIENLKSNFSADSRAQHSFVEITESNGTKTLALHVDGNAATLAWTGETETNGNKIWDLKNTDNWSDGNDQTVDQFYSDDNVTFGVVMGDADNDPNTADVAIDQVVTVADAGVKIGTMQVTGGNYIFEGGEISSVAGMGDIAITGGNVTFNNSITTDGSMTITGAPVIFNAANSWTGDTVISGGNAVVKVTDAQGLSTTKTTLNNGAELQLAVDGTLSTSEMVLNSGNIYAQGDVTVNNLLLTNNAAKSLNADTGKTMTVTVSGDTVRNTLYINEYKEVAGTVNMTVSNALTDMDNIIVGKGALNATFNGNVAQGGDITYRNSTTGSMTFNGTAEVGKLNIGNADVSMSFKGAATTGEISVNGDANDQKKLVAVFDSTANISKITGNGGAMDVTVKGAANVGDIASGTCNTDIDFQGGLTGTKVTVGDKVTNLSFGANSSLTGAITVNNAGKLALNGGSGVTLTTASVQLNNTSVVEVTGGMTLSTDSLMGSGTLKLVGSGLSISAATVGTNVVMENGGKLTTTNGAGTTMAAGKRIQLTGNGVTSMAGTWTLDSTNLVQSDSTAGLKLLSGAQLKVNSDMTLSGLDVDNGATYKAANDADAWTLSMNGGSSIHGTAAENITVKVIGGQNWINEGGTAQGDVVVDSALTDLNNLTIGGGWANANSTSVKSLTVESGRVTVNQYNTGSKILIGTGKVDVDGASAVLNLSGHSGVSNGRVAALSVADGSAIADINLIEGSLENAQNWTGLVNIVDEGEARTYGMGNIGTAASVHLGNMAADAATGEYTRLTNAGSLKLAGDNTLTLINTMTLGDSVFGAAGAVTLADDAKLHIDINTVLSRLLRATENTPYATTFNLGGDLTALQHHDNVVFDTALSLFNLEAEFGADGLLTLTQYAPVGNIYQSTVKQGDSTDWNAEGKDVYDSAEGYSAILIDKDTEIDLTQEAPAAAQTGLGIVLNNLIGTADSTLSITGNGDDLVTIANTVSAAEYNSMSGNIAVKDADVQILHTESMGYGAPVVNTESTYVVKGSMTLEGGELKLAAGKLQLDGDDNQLLGGVTVADDGQAQLILNGTTTLGGSINHAAAADMLKATGVTLPALARIASQPAHIELGAGSTTALADGAMVESGVVISGTGAATVTVAEGASAAISQGAVLTGAALKLAEGTTLTVDTTEGGGKLSLTGADIDGTLASTGPVDAAIKVTQAAGGTSTYAGSMNGYTGDIELTGAGTHKLAADATGADMIAKGTNVVVAPASGTVVAYRSLSVDADSTLTMDAAIDGSKANRKVHTTNGVTLAGDMNLTAHLSTEREGGLVFTGGTVEVKDGATINLVVNSVSDRIANALVSEGETCVTLAESATGFADVVITSNDQRINKYLHNAVVRVVDGKLVLTGETVNGETAQFHQQLAVTPNGHAGADLLDNAYGSSMKAINDAESDVKAVLAHLETVIVNGNTAGTDEVLAAVAGASSAVLGMAASGDVDRQLQAIRNRTTIMGVDQSVVQEGMPYFNAWINAEADLRELSDKGTEGGYELNSWGGTVGFDVDVCPTFTAGMALTAMYGDLTATGADSSKGDMSTYYLSAFARYASNAWTHTFVGTMGLVDLSMKRTVNYGGGSYEAEADTDGMSFGLMYEVGRVFTLSEDGTTCLQPMFNVAWRHTTISGYTEKSAGDAALKVDDQTMDTLTFGLGARLQAIVGEDMFNRTSIFECRLLAKMDAGDSSCSTNSALAAYNDTKAEITSAEMGAFGIEAGAGLSVPVGDEGGSLFMDASIEVRSDYTNMNATVGYRVNF